MPPLEPLESLFLRLAPELTQEWRGAHPDQINAIERIAGRPLPGFYRWFLERMGGDMGSMSYDLVDFSAETILAVYENAAGLRPDGRHLLIGYNEDEIMPVHIFYDLEQSVRDDCLVGQMEIDSGYLQPTFETFREMLGWAKFTNRLVRRKPQVCSGTVSTPNGLVRPRVDGVLKDMGFSDLLVTGPFCALYELDDVVVSFTGAPDMPPRMLVFNLGGPQAGILRRIVGQLATASDLHVEVHEWKPSLS